MSKYILQLSTFLFEKKSTVFILIFIFYVLFPTNNSSLDAFAYAGYADYNSYLFKPHHLLSHAFIYALIQPIKALGLNIDTLWFGKFINSVFLILNLLIFYKILALVKIEKKQRLLYILVIGFSFNLWQYGTENEVHIVPIAFSLLASYYFLKSSYQKNYKHIIISGTLTAIACLFHQLHFFWWLGLLTGFCFYYKNVKSFLLYAIPALIVPIAYAIVLVFYEHQELTISNLIHFMLYDFYQEGIVDASYSWNGWKSVLFQAVNTVRIFLQAHPNIYVLLKAHWMYFIPLIGSLFLGFRLLWQFLKQRNIFTKRENSLTLFANIHLYIFIAIYLFAFYSYGNIEFLVSVPFLILIYLSIRFEIHQKFLKRLILLLFIWNFSFGIFPDNYYKFYNDEKLVDYIIQNPDKTFLVKNSDIGNQYFYKTGINFPPNVLYYDKISKDSLISVLNTQEIYTDVIDKPVIFNRTKIAAIGNEAFLLDSYQKDSIFSFEGLYGVSVVYKISK